MIQFRGGLLPNDPTKERLRLGRHLAILPDSPPLVDYLSQVTTWPMFRNDLVADCVWATIGHTLQQTSLYGSGAQVGLADADVLKGYMDVTGYEPTQTKADGSNPTDVGTRIQDALGYWRTTGMGPDLGPGRGPHKILAFAEVDIRSRYEVQTAIRLFGSLHIGMRFPASAEAQFNAGQPWDVVVGGDGGIRDGHAIPVGYYDTVGRRFRGVTWATPQDMTWAFWDAYVTEGWIVVTPEWLNVHGLSPAGIDLQGLGEQLAVLTKTPNPFLSLPPLAPPPPPPPPPMPPVFDPVASANLTLASVARPWVRAHHLGPANRRMAAGLLEWLAAIGQN
ncbi:MAG: hypothetical protein ACRDRO_23420 [Pseudonocardiaceae bacterium]